MTDSFGDNAKGVLREARTKFDAHHDFTSSVRQRAIADLACIVDITMLGVYFFVVGNWNWDLSVSDAAGAVVVILWSLGFVGMGLSSSLPGFVRRMLRHLGEGPAYEELDEPQWMTTYRKYLYYPAAYITFVAMAIWVELSGGLVNSPFTAVFFTGILGAQQLSRHKLNSLLFILFGVLSTIFLAVYEAIVGIPSQPPAPAELSFYILAAAFLITAICVHAAKSPNFRARGVFPEPTHTELYRTPGDHLWRFAIYHGSARLDTVLELGSDSTMIQAQQQVTDIMLGLCNGEQRVLEWHSQDGEESSMGYIRRAI